MRNIVKNAVLLLAGLFLIGGCVGTQQMTKTTPIQDLDAPEWVVKGSGAFEAEKGRVFYGVSSAFGIKNPPLLRTASENRSRNELAKVLEFYNASIMKDYMASTMADDPSVTAEEQHVEQAIKTVTSMTLSGVEVVDYWQHPATGELFSLARLDFQAFKESLEKAQQLDAGVKEYIRANADRLHQELNFEESKKRVE